LSFDILELQKVVKRASLCPSHSLAQHQEFEAVPDPACRSACMSSRAWAEVLAVADIIQGVLRFQDFRSALDILANVMTFDSYTDTCVTPLPTGKDVDVPLSILPPQEIENWRENHIKRPLCPCFGSH
jgi:hypothetical protein